MTIGIIAENDSDVAVMKEITPTSLKPHRVGFRKFVGHGGGKVQCKSKAWAENLVQQGCRWIALIHDLDTNDEAKLRAHLEAAVSLVNAEARVVVIPKREIESWLLYDGSAIAAAFRQAKQPKLPSDPESLADPKKHLRDLVWRTYRKDYLITVHNPKIAEKIDLSLLQRSESFAPYPPFCAAIRDSLAAKSVAPRMRRRSGGAARRH